MYKDIAECYDGQSVLLTGGTGFIGKVVMEKLLYSCPGLEKLYVLVREKNNTSPQQRMLKIIEQPIFARLRNERPEMFDKIVPIAGDITESELGLKVEDRELLMEKVNFVFHLAATVKFDETLDVALNINVGGTERMLDLSRRMKNIKVFVHVSTAYSNTNRSIIDEVLYPAPASLDEVKKFVRKGLTEKKVKEILKDAPNTYTFTKALAEQLVAKNHGVVPSIIIRPSIVTCCNVEPVIGSVDRSIFVSFTSGISTGCSHVVMGRPTTIMDFIPVDYVSNLIIVAAVKSKWSNGVEVYNCCTSAENPITLKYFIKLIIDESYKNKFYGQQMPFTFVTRFEWVFLLLKIIFQTVPAFIADMFLWLRGRERRHMKIQAKVAYVNKTSKYFTLNSWMIRASRTRALADSLSPADKRKFIFDPKDILWEKHIPINCQLSKL